MGEEPAAILEHSFGEYLDGKPALITIISPACVHPVQESDSHWLIHVSAYAN